jgi:hypothetical protein
MATTYIPISTQTLSSATSTVTFSSIPATYTDLVLVCNVGGSAAGNGVSLRFNSDSSSVYSDTGLWGTGSSAASGRHSNSNTGALTIAVGVTNNPSDVVIIANIQNYANTTTNKVLLSRATNANASASYPGSEAVVTLWRNTAAINTIALSNGANFVSGSTFALYGVTAANLGAKATGGDFIGNDGSYFYHVFNSSGTFTPLQSLSTDVLVIAGGGGGGGAVNGSIGGGGGAGGFQYFTGQAVTATGYSITVGAGGAGGSSSPGSGTNGSNSVFGALTASVGGGYGGAGHGTASGASGGNGGSGGGAGFSTNTTTVGGTGTAGQGNNGGNEGVGGGGAGGGGAGGAGANPTAGAGSANSITGTSTTYATGGSASGAAGNGVTPSNPTPNLGIGGAAGWNAAGGAGGSGVVIVRYPI